MDMELSNEFGAPTMITFSALMMTNPYVESYWAGLELSSHIELMDTGDPFVVSVPEDPIVYC